MRGRIDVSLWNIWSAPPGRYHGWKLQDDITWWSESEMMESLICPDQFHSCIAVRLIARCRRTEGEERREKEKEKEKVEAKLKEAHYATGRVVRSSISKPKTFGEVVILGNASSDSIIQVVTSVPLIVWWSSSYADVGVDDQASWSAQYYLTFSPSERRGSRNWPGVTIRLPEHHHLALSKM